MTATRTTGSSVPHHVAAARPAAPEVGRGRQLQRVLAAEWVKARSVPSTWSALGSTAFIMIAIGAAICSLVPEADVTGPARGQFEPMLQVMAGVTMAQVALSVLGSLLLTSEHTSGSIASTLAAVPQRGVLLTGKALLLVVLVTPFALPACALAAVVGLAVLRDKGLQLALTDPAVVRAVLGTTLVLVLTALLGLAVGALLRSTAAAVIVLTVVLFLLPVLVALLPDGITNTVGPWLPSNAGGAVLLLEPRDGYLSPGAGLAFLATCTALALAAAGWRLRRTDA